jgi:hypothetical protein
MAGGEAGRLVGSLGFAACAAAIVMALLLSAVAAAGQLLPPPTVGSRPPSGPMQETTPPDRGTTDLGTEYDPFIIGWRSGPATIPTSSLSPGVGPPRPTPTDR